MDIHQYNTGNKDCPRKTKSVTDTGLERSVKSFVTDWNILSNDIRNLPASVDFKRAIFSRF